MRAHSSSYLLSLLIATAIGYLATTSEAAERPHIIYFLADDLGWTDVGWHGGDIKTTHLDRLAADGARLEQFYVLPVCSPTRAALMTGRYPIRHGLQLSVVRPWAQYGLPLEERTLPQALKEAGYATAIVGKWHLGHFRPEYLPTRRGFDMQYGHYNGMIDYFTHIRDGGHDWHRNDKVNRDEGYSTRLIGDEAVRIVMEHDIQKPLFLYVPFNAPHSPLQVEEAYLDQYKHITDSKRRSYAAMVQCLDEQVGRVVASVEQRGMKANTLFLFSSDNGGPEDLGATNGPLRAGKGTLYEGGTRVPAFATWYGKIAPGKLIQEPLHIVDWFPTLLSLTGVSLEQSLPVDGRNLWPVIMNGASNLHETILINSIPNSGAIRMGKWKLVMNGQVGANDLESGASKGKGKKKQDNAKGSNKLELFDLESDPAESRNVAESHSDIVQAMQKHLSRYADEAVAPKAEGLPADFKAPTVWGESVD